MIKTEQIQKLVSALKSRTLTSVKENQRCRVPLVLEGVKTSRTYGDTEYDDSLAYDDISVYHQYNYLVNMKKYHYDDKWYYAIDSVDYPYKSFGVVRVNDEKMPYRTFEPLMNKKSFIMRLDGLIYRGLCEPILVFINRKFVNWYNIDVVYDCGDTYLLLHGTDYTYWKLRTAKLNMVTLPYSIDYIGTEDDDYWQLQYDMLLEFLQESLYLTSANKLAIEVPTISSEYRTPTMVYGVGAWMYTQMRLYKLGLLSDDRIAKLKKMNLTYYEYDDSGNVSYTYITKFNALDVDSFDKEWAQKIYHMQYDNYIDKALMRFDADGTMNQSSGELILALIDEDLYTDYYTSSSKIVSYQQADLGKVLFRENYLVFKDGLFYAEQAITQAAYNTISIDNSEKYKVELFTFCDTNIESLITVGDTMKNDELLSTILGYLNGSVTVSDDLVAVLDELLEALDYEYTDSNLYEENYQNGFDAIMAFDPRIFNSLYHTNVYSRVFTGAECNKNLTITFSYESRRGLKIPRYKYRSHETYVMVFVNGELLDTYYKMIAFANFFLVPMETESFNSDDVVEILYFTNINNNEIEFELTDDMLEERFSDSSDDSALTVDIFSQYIRPEELKIFCGYPVDIMEYDGLITEASDEISYNVSYRDSSDSDTLYVYKDVIESTTRTNTFTAVSSRKFIYERLYPDQLSYRLKLSSRFRFCDNQKQYMLFINGRRMEDESFLITIPKFSRPFWTIYLYTTRFVDADDRVEIFYVPYEVLNVNTEKEPVTLDSNGYIEAVRQNLEVPYDTNLYTYYLNGKKIPSTWLTSIDTSTLRVNQNPKTLKHFVVNKSYRDTLDEVVEYLQGDSYSTYDNVIKMAKALGYDTLDDLFGINVTLTDTEADMIGWDTGPIAIINEIVRDFWVTSGYQYNDVVTFIYDYALDEYIVDDEDGEFKVLPSMDATQYLNIPKTGDVHLLYFTYSPTETILEMGSTLKNVILTWAYSTPIFGEWSVLHQYISGEEIDKDLRKYSDPDSHTEDITYALRTESTSGLLEASVTYHFYNGIYYGNVDEDSLQWYTTTDEEVTGSENPVVDEYFYADELQELIPKLDTCILQDTVKVDLSSYILGNNNYFVYAAPYRLCYKNNKSVIEFITPDISADEVVNAGYDGHTVPVYTNGELDEDNQLVRLASCKMEYMGQLNYTNSSGYTEPYCVWKSNGFFSRLYDEYEFEFHIRDNTENTLEIQTVFTDDDFTD